MIGGKFTRRVLPVVVAAAAPLFATDRALAVSIGDPCGYPGHMGHVVANPSPPPTLICSTQLAGGSAAYARWAEGRLASIHSRINDIIDRRGDLRGDARFILWSPQDPWSLATEYIGLSNEQDALEAEQSRISQSLGALRYAPQLESRDPIAAALKQPAVPGSPAASASGVTLSAGSSVSRTTSSEIAGSAFGGLPSYLGGSSSVSTASGGTAAFDLSRKLGLPPDQRFGIVVGAWANTSSQQGRASVLTGGLSSSGASNGATFGFAAGYSFAANYVLATVLYGLGADSLSIGGVGHIGSYGARSATADVEVGRTFNIWNAKAEGVRAIADGWKTVSLDLAGHFGIASSRANSFMDALGGFNPQAGADTRQVGASARLSALFKSGRLLFIPFAKTGFDLSIDPKMWSDGPSYSIGGAVQPPSLYAFDRVRALVEGGLDIRGFSGLTLTSSIRVQRASTSTTIGGRLALKVPLN